LAGQTGDAGGLRSGGDVRVLLIGEGQLATGTSRALAVAGADVTRLESPSDRDIRSTLDDDVDRAVVVSRHDHVALRRALVLAQIRPGLPILVTIFDRNVASTLERTATNVRVLSTADLVAPTLAAPCLDQRLLSLIRSGEDTEAIVGGPSGPERTTPTWSTPTLAQRLVANLESLVRPFDSSARILVYGLLGFFAVLAAETAVTITAEHEPFLEALYLAAKVTVTVGPNTAADHAHGWVKAFSILAMISTVGIAALLTAGLVNRLTDPRLTGITGRAAVPRRRHVIVIGLGQIGFRLCGLLRDLGVPVVAVEQNPNAKNVTRARDEGLPVVIGSGASRRTLRRVSIRSARALAAVTSDEIENIATAVAARGLHPDLAIALRAGDGDATSEVQSLFGIGVVRDVYRLAGTALAACALGQHPVQVFPHRDQFFLVRDDQTIEGFCVLSDASR
jgi:Trk K+ transport system NAD-binding subunit